MDWISLASGPLGALAITLPTAAYALKKLEARYSSELQSQREYRVILEQENAASRAALEKLHQARLADSQSAAHSLLEVYQKVHDTLDRLEELVRSKGSLDDK